MASAPSTERRGLATAAPGPRRWQREFTAGYTGFVPTKNQLFGKTNGAIVRELCLTGGRPEELDALEMTRHLEQKSSLPTSKDINPEVYSYRSRQAVNWICGPTHEIRQQHIPGYTGQCRGFVNKDFMQKSYAKVTAELFSHRHPMGSEQDTRTRFTATQRAAFRPSNFRRFGK